MATSNGKPAAFSRSDREKYMETFVSPFLSDADKYEKLAKIGHGTFGEVFKAREKNTTGKRFVAMKRVIMEDQKEGFPLTAIREIKILSLLKNENVVDFIEMCYRKPTANNGHIATFYLVFGFCEHDLSGLLKNEKVQFTLGEIKTVMKQLLNGLFYLHRNNILHRDVKPANILITKSGQLKIADFGLSRAGLTKSARALVNGYTNRVVTLWYRPPELLLGDRDYGPAVDLWGVGCIMAEMWTRFPILQGDSEQRQLFLITKLCGAITPAVWPGVERLPLYDKLKLPADEHRKVRDRLKPYVQDPLACELLDNLLVLDPRRRLDADKALYHNFFYSEPDPEDLARMLGRHTQCMFDYVASQRQADKLRLYGGGKPSRTAENGGYQDRIF